MTRTDIEKLVDRYDTKAEKAYRNYQETGTQRYERERQNNEDLADALRIALGSIDDHNLLLHLRSEFNSLAARAEAAQYKPEPEKEREAILKELVSIAISSCGYRGMNA